MVRANKSLGQHFLRDPSVVAKAVDALELRGDECVLEIGPGKGVLTEALAAHARKVVAVELDPGLAMTGQAMFADNVTVLHGDILDFEADDLPAFDKVAGNLPYQISSPLTFKVLDWDFERAVFLYQLEFAERLSADGPDDPHYGRLSVARAYRAKATLLRRVKKGAFLPPPKVMSGLVLLVPHDEEPFDIGGDKEWFDLVLRELWSQRRKTLRKAIMNRAAALGLGDIPPATVDGILDAADAVDRRVDDLDPAGYGRLAKVLGDYREGA